MRVLVTGGSGFLATHIIEQLVSRGYQIRCTVRDKNKFRLSGNEQIELLEGDILDFNFISKASENCDFVIHAAAQTPGKVVDKKIFYEVNVKGTANVLRAAAKQGCRRLIFVSTANTIGYGSRENPGNEMHSIKSPFTSFEYATTKLRAEELVLSYKDKMDVVILNPTFLLGPYMDRDGSGQLLYRAFNKRFVFYPAGGKNIVHVKDVANATINSMIHGRNGEQYLLSGENMSYRTIYTLAANESRKMARILVPIPSIILAITGLIGSVLNYFGLRTVVSYSNVQALMITCHYSNQKAVDELSVSFSNAREVMRDSVDWMVRQTI